MIFAFLSVRPERFDFDVLDIAAQNISQRDKICSREFVQAIALSIVCADAYEYVAFKQFAPDIDIGFDVTKEYEEANRMMAMGL